MSRMHEVSRRLGERGATIPGEAHSSFEKPDCGHCGASEADTVLAGCTDVRHGRAGSFNIVRCGSCGLAFLSPRPSLSNISEYYPDDYLPHGRPRDENAGGGARLLEVVRSLLVKPYEIRFGPEAPRSLTEQGGRALDAGCGSGHLLSRLAGAGWEVHGCDVSRLALERANEFVEEATLHHGRLPEIELPGSSFDLVTMMHVLEHTHRPMENLRAIFHLLREGGRLLVTVPNFASAEARVFRRYWMGLDVPRHLYFFKPQSLCRMIESAGFSIQRVRPEIRPSSLAGSLGNVFRAFSGEHRHFRLEDYLYYGFFPLSVLSSVLGNWGSIEVTAVR